MLSSLVRLFASLDSDSTRPLPYSQDIAQNRYRYGESMLRRSADHIAAQELYEAQAKARMDVARRQRQEERERLDEEQHRRILEVQRKAEDLAQRRKELREKAEEWATARKAESGEEDRRVEKGRKAVSRKPRQEMNLSGEENGDGRRLKRVSSLCPVPHLMLTQLLQVRAKKRFVDDEEDGLSSAAHSAKRKKIKSKEIIDSEDDM